MEKQKIKMKTKFKEIAKKSLAGLALIGILTGLIFHDKHSREVYQNFMKAVNGNKFGVLTCDEFEKAYDTFGLNYDCIDSNPREDLSLMQMKQYIEDHK